jgi:predicted RNA binding protein YcfA (HicA-like mRNA interferase family)
MSPFLPQVRAKDVVRVAKRLGFELDRQKGSHASFIIQTTNPVLSFQCIPIVT